MKNLIGLLLVLILSTPTLNAQDNYGFYGKKTYVDISSSSYIPLIYNLTTYEPVYELSSSGNYLVARGEQWLNTGLRVSLSRALKTNVGFGLEFGFDQFLVGGRTLSYHNTSYNRHESVRINSFLFLPRLELSGSNGLLPNGLVHQVGLGVHINKVQKRAYLIDHGGGVTTGGPNSSESDILNIMKNHKLDESFNMMQIMYGLKMRTPLGKRIMINYGFRYTIDFGVLPVNSNYTLNRAIRSYQFRNLIAFDLGLTVPF